jgi:hypothetical protein
MKQLKMKRMRFPYLLEISSLECCNWLYFSLVSSAIRASDVWSLAVWEASLGAAALTGFGTIVRDEPLPVVPEAWEA